MITDPSYVACFFVVVVFLPLWKFLRTFSLFPGFEILLWCAMLWVFFFPFIIFYGLVCPFTAGETSSVKKKMSFWNIILTPLLFFQFSNNTFWTFWSELIFLFFLICFLSFCFAFTFYIWTFLFFLTGIFVGFRRIWK